MKTILSQCSKCGRPLELQADDCPEVFLTILVRVPVRCQACSQVKRRSPWWNRLARRLLRKAAL